MKKIIICAIAVLSCLAAAAQAKLETKKFKIADFQDCITKVVLTGNDMADSFLRKDVVDRWTISPFEFCTAEEFEAAKTSPNTYFLTYVSGQYGHEISPGIEFLTLVKGGPEAVDGIGAMTEVVSIPCGPVKGFGRETAFLPALLDIIQNYTLKAIEKELASFAGLGLYNRNLPATGIKRIYMANDDISFRVKDADKVKYIDEDIVVTDEDDVDEVLAKGTYNTLVSFVVAPLEPTAGSMCHKMLIGADDHKLYYTARHKITGKTGVGFLTSDLKKIAKPR